MTNFALNHLIVESLNGTYFFGHKLVAEPNGLSFYDCSGSDGRRCATCPKCFRVDSEIRAQVELHVEPLTSEIRMLTEELKRVKLDDHAQQTSLAQKLDPYIKTAEFIPPQKCSTGKTTFRS